MRRQGREGGLCLKSEIAGRRQVIDYWRCARLFSIRRQFYPESDGVCDPLLFPSRLEIVNQGTELTINC